MHIPFVCMVKFQFLAHLPVDHLADPIMSSLIFLLRLFVIDGFISVTALFTFTVLLRLIYSRFDMIGSYGVVLCCYKERFCFSLKVSFS